MTFLVLKRVRCYYRYSA